MNGQAPGSGGNPALQPIGGKDEEGALQSGSGPRVSLHVSYKLSTRSYRPDAFVHAGFRLSKNLRAARGQGYGSGVAPGKPSVIWSVKTQRPAKNRSRTQVNCFSRAQPVSERVFQGTPVLFRFQPRISSTTQIRNQIP